MQSIASQFWDKWLRLYLPELHRRQKWQCVNDNVKVGDLVLVVGENLPRGQWPLGLVIHTYLSRDGLVRSLRLKIGPKELVRPISKIVILEGVKL